MGHENFSYIEGRFYFKDDLSSWDSAMYQRRPIFERFHSVYFIGKLNLLPAGNSSNACFVFWGGKWTIYSQQPICQTSQVCLQSSFVGPKCNRSDMLATINGIPRTFISLFGSVLPQRYEYCGLIWEVFLLFIQEIRAAV